jgi:PhnB protein
MEGGINPYIFVEDTAGAIAWYRDNLGAVEVFVMPGPGGHGVMHAEIKLGENTLMLGDANAEWGTAAPSGGLFSSNLMVYVPDVDSTFEACITKGATELAPVMDMFWGDRVGKIRDPFGHIWILATHVEDVAPEELAERAKAAFGG